MTDLSVFGLQSQLIPADGLDVSSFGQDLDAFGGLHQQGPCGGLQPTNRKSHASVSDPSCGPLSPSIGSDLTLYLQPVCLRCHGVTVELGYYDSNNNNTLHIVSPVTQLLLKGQDLIILHDGRIWQWTNTTRHVSGRSGFLRRNGNPLFLPVDRASMGYKCLQCLTKDSQTIVSGLQKKNFLILVGAHVIVNICQQK